MCFEVAKCKSTLLATVNTFDVNYAMCLFVHCSFMSTCLCSVIRSNVKLNNLQKSYIQCVLNWLHKLYLNVIGNKKTER